MIRRALVLALALAWSPTILHAQDVVFTVSVPSADVYKGPSNVTPVVGHVPRGKALPVLRNLGSWVKVPWPDAPDGVGYVHVTMGRETLADGVAPKTSPPRSSDPAVAPSASARPPASAPARTAQVSPPPAAPRQRVAIRTQQDATPITHVWAVGGGIGSTSSFGVTTRAWRDNRLGMQVGFARESMASAVTAGRQTTVQIEPAVVFGLADFVSDYFWIRPFVGSGVSIRHQTLRESSPAGAAIASENGVGWRAFGGTELTFAGLPRFALSVEAGYRRLPEPFPGFEPDRVTASISGHWYIK